MGFKIVVLAIHSSQIHPLILHAISIFVAWFDLCLVVLCCSLTSYFHAGIQVVWCLFQGYRLKCSQGNKNKVRLF